MHLPGAAAAAASSSSSFHVCYSNLRQVKSASRWSANMNRLRPAAAIAVAAAAAAAALQLVCLHLNGWPALPAVAAAADASDAAAAAAEPAAELAAAAAVDRMDRGPAEDVTSGSAGVSLLQLPAAMANPITLTIDTAADANTLNTRNLAAAARAGGGGGGGKGLLEDGGAASSSSFFDNSGQWSVHTNDRNYAWPSPVSAASHQLRLSTPVAVKEEQEEQQQQQRGSIETARPEDSLEVKTRSELRRTAAGPRHRGGGRSRWWPYGPVASKSDAAAAPAAGKQADGAAFAFERTAIEEALHTQQQQHWAGGEEVGWSTAAAAEEDAAAQGPFRELQLKRDVYFRSVGVVNLQKTESGEHVCVDGGVYGLGTARSVAGRETDGLQSIPPRVTLQRRPGDGISVLGEADDPLAAAAPADISIPFANNVNDETATDPNRWGKTVTLVCTAKGQPVVAMPITEVRYIERETVDKKRLDLEKRVAAVREASSWRRAQRYMRYMKNVTASLLLIGVAAVVITSVATLHTRRQYLKQQKKTMEHIALHSPAALGPYMRREARLMRQILGFPPHKVTVIEELAAAAAAAAKQHPAPPRPYPATSSLTAAAYFSAYSAASSAGELRKIRRSVEAAARAAKFVGQIGILHLIVRAGCLVTSRNARSYSRKRGVALRGEPMENIEEQEGSDIAAAAADDAAVAVAAAAAAAAREQGGGGEGEQGEAREAAGLAAAERAASRAMAATREAAAAAARAAVGAVEGVAAARDIPIEVEGEEEQQQAPLHHSQLFSADEQQQQELLPAPEADVTAAAAEAAGEGRQNEQQQQQQKRGWVGDYFKRILHRGKACLSHLYKSVAYDPFKEEDDAFLATAQDIQDKWKAAETLTPEQLKDYNAVMILPEPPDVSSEEQEQQETTPGPYAGQLE